MRKAIAVLLAAFVVAALIAVWLQSFPGFGSLSGETWQWTELQVHQSWGSDSTLVVADPEHYTLVFNPDGTAVLTADCNRTPWTYTSSGRSIQLFSHATEWSTCGAGSLAQSLVDVLWRSDSHRVGFGTLVLEGQRGEAWFGGEMYRLTFRAR